jgi:hypothetical protein
MIENGRGKQTSAASQRRTRRQLLAGGAAAAGAVAAEVLAPGTPAAAANGNPVTMGQLNQATSNTSINDSGGDTTFTALGTASGTALEGDAVDGTGVSGTSVTGIGVSGTTGSAAASAAAVRGEITSTSPGAFSAAVRGQNDGTGANGIGVYGSHAGNGWGVYGTSDGGTGVFGTATTGTGVEGSGPTGVFGVASTPNGVGVLAQNSGGGPALKVDGVAAFSRSGVATVPSGKSQATEHLPLTSASFVLATIQANVTGLYVRGVTITAGSPGSFTIHLSKAVSSNTGVAWLAVN